MAFQRTGNPIVPIGTATCSPDERSDIGVVFSVMPGLVPGIHDFLTYVMPGLGPGIHVLLRRDDVKTWMAGTSPAMTKVVNSV